MNFTMKTFSAGIATGFVRHNAGNRLSRLGGKSWAIGKAAESSKFIAEEKCKSAIRLGNGETLKFTKRLIILRKSCILLAT